MQNTRPAITSAATSRLETMPGSTRRKPSSATAPDGRPLGMTASAVTASMGKEPTAWIAIRTGISTSMPSPISSITRSGSAPVVWNARASQPWYSRVSSMVVTVVAIPMRASGRKRAR